jgi:hypothetical protein
VMTYEKYKGETSATEVATSTVTALKKEGLSDVYSERVLSPNQEELGHITLLKSEKGSSIVWTNGRHFLHLQGASMEKVAGIKKTLPF